MGGTEVGRGVTANSRRTGIPVLYDQCAPNGSERLLYLADVGTMVWIDKPADGGLTQTEAFGQGDVGHALLAHRPVQGDLGCGKGGNGNIVLALRDGTWEWNVLTQAAVGAVCAHERVLGHCEGLGPVFT